MYKGKILYVDLSSGKINEEELPEKLLHDYIGGSGVNARLFYDIVRSNPDLDPLSPQNPLIFGAGPLVGTTFPCATRYTVTSKSPLTRIFGDSNAGGFFGVRMRQAGYDHIVIKGQSEKPVSLLIERGKKPEIIDAEDIWGLDTYVSDDAIQEKYGRCESARIGVAGENLVRYASIFSGTQRVSANGRAGMGCVMGSKKLKAVIVKGNEPILVADKKKFDELAKFYGDLWTGGPQTGANAEYGTLILIAQAGAEAAANNDQFKISPENLEKYDLGDFITKYKDGKSSCYRCPVGCSQKWKVDEGKYKGEHGDKIEFGHYVNLGPLIGVYDFPSLFHLADLVNRAGMDVTQFGWNLSMAMECFQRGIIGTEDTDGVELNWGDVDLISDLILKTSKREGFGSLLAESMPDAVKRIGPDAEQYGFHTKGMTFPYRRKGMLPMALASAVGPRGADHMKGHPFSSLVNQRDMLERIFGKDVPEEAGDHKSPVAKGRVVWWHENFKMLIDSLGFCFVPVASTNIFGDPLMMFEEIGEIYEAATGIDPSHLFEAAERAYQVEKSYNALLGLKRDDDLRKGTTRGETDQIDQPGMLDEYYFYRGCSKDGIPTKKRLNEIGLSDVAEDLEKAGKISDSTCPSINELVISQAHP